MKRLMIVFCCMGFMTCLVLKTGAQVLEPAPRDGVYDKTAIKQLQPIPYSPLREADIVWTKRIWRVIDLREKLNQPFYYPEKPQNNWRNFVTIVMDALKEGSVSAYSALTDDQFLTPISYKELMERLQPPDTISMPDPENPDSMITKVVPKEFRSTQVKKLRVKEDWFFDKQRSVMEVRILGICPVRDKIDERTGENKGEDRLFWLYFPECRPLFAQNQVFNLKNGEAGRLSYDDIFMKRLFNSYIIKEENVYDRQINEYLEGVDALYEAERAKNTLFEFEHSLWEY